jgi:ERCC4-type nuclease
MDNIVIIVDSREKKWLHIKEFFKKWNIDYEVKKLDYGDYSFKLPACTEYGIAEDIYFTEIIVIERKANLLELSNNLSKERKRFERELERARGSKFMLLIENATYQDIVYHHYASEFKPQSFVATLATYQARYGIEIAYVDQKCSGNFILNLFKYHLREWLKVR